MQSNWWEKRGIMSHEATHPGRGNRLIQRIERRLALSRAHALGKELGNIATEANLEHPYFSAQIEGRCFHATLHPIIYDADAFIEGAVLLDYERAHKPVLNLRAHTFSDRFNGGEYLYSSADPSSIITLEHLMVIGELRNRIRNAAEDPGQKLL